MIPVLVAILCITLQVPETARAQQIQSFCGPTSPTCPPPTFTWLDIPLDTATYRSNQYVIAGGWAFQCTRPIQHYAIELDGVFMGRYASGPVPTPAPAIFAGYKKRLMVMSDSDSHLRPRWTRVARARSVAFQPFSAMSSKIRSTL